MRHGRILEPLSYVDLLISRLCTLTKLLTSRHATHFRRMRYPSTLSSKHMRDVICSSGVRLSCVPTYLKSPSRWLKTDESITSIHKSCDSGTAVQ